MRDDGRPPRSGSPRWLVIGLSALAFLSLTALLNTFTSWSAQSRPGPSLQTDYRPINSSGNNGGEVTRPDYQLDMQWDNHAPAQKREYHWEVQDIELNPDGVYRPMTVINGQFPGPLIECNEGDTVNVHVKNAAANATSIHWHGIYNNGTNWLDGSPVTQCPIASGTSFTYEFRVSGQAGTFWYHAGHASQASDGLVGPFIVHPRDDAGDKAMHYDTDRVLMVSDHYYDPSGALLMDYLQSDRENVEPVPGHALINGQGVRNCDELPKRRCDNSTASIPTINLPVQSSHRLRIINSGALAEFQIQVDEHEFAITEVDGTTVSPTFFHRLKISPGQRYSIIVSTNVSTHSAYWLRARMVATCFSETSDEMSPEALAIVRYQHADSKTSVDTGPPQSRDWPESVELECSDMNATDLRPVRAMRAPEKADSAVYLRANFEIGAWRLSRGFFNDSSWRAPTSSPSLHRALDGLAARNASFFNETALDSSRVGAFVNDLAFNRDRELVIQTATTTVIDVILSNFDDGNHPFHLHGHQFFILASGHGYPPKDYASEVQVDNPLRRDTASVEGFGWMIIRFVADNPGMWAFHCHVSWHTDAGLLMHFLIRTDDMAEWTLPETQRDLCQRPGIELGKTPDDDLWFGNFGDSTGGDHG